ncbi:MAG: glycerophosphodiester phosphodiesterase [Clostridia bacterium]|nr:glycerophosphodiester phosphodiesterase [Clostridia bacterium]
MEPIYIVLIAIGSVLLLFILYLFAIKPRFNKKAVKPFLEYKYAHRGLHDDTAEENSVTAFERAIEKGYGIEIDVRFSKDGELMVFHDATLNRVCNIDKRVVDLTCAELKEIKLGKTEDTIPTFKEVLDLVNGTVPLLIEIKQDVGEGDVATATAEALENYKGDYMIQSFNPLAVATFKKKMPRVVRGILSDNYMRKKEMRKPLYFVLKNLLLNFLCRPDFVSFNHWEYKKSFTLRFVKRVFRPVLFAWTLRAAEEEKAANRNGFHGIIFEWYEA